MGFIDILSWIGVTGVVGSSVGMGAAKLASQYLKEQDKKKIVRVIEGEIPNTLKLDGNLVQVSKFQYKKSDGKIVKVELKDLAKKSSQKALNEEKTSLLSTLLSKLKNKFRKKK